MILITFNCKVNLNNTCLNNTGLNYCLNTYGLKYYLNTFGLNYYLNRNYTIVMSRSSYLTNRVLYTTVKPHVLEKAMVDFVQQNCSLNVVFETYQYPEKLGLENECNSGIVVLHNCVLKNAAGEVVYLPTEDFEKLMSRARDSVNDYCMPCDSNVPDDECKHKMYLHKHSSNEEGWMCTTMIKFLSEKR